MQFSYGFRVQKGGIMRKWKLPGVVSTFANLLVLPVQNCTFYHISCLLQDLKQHRLGMYGNMSA